MPSGRSSSSLISLFSCLEAADFLGGVVRDEVIFELWMMPLEDLVSLDVSLFSLYFKNDDERSLGLS